MMAGRPKPRKTRGRNLNQEDGKMSREYGKNYEERLNVKTIAKRVRQDLKKIKDVKFSVRIERFSMGQAIRIELKSIGSPLFSEGFTKKLAETKDVRKTFEALADREFESRYSKRVNWVLDRAKKILESYNYDGSDVMTDYSDVNFYGTAKVDYVFEQNVLKNLML